MGGLDGRAGVVFGGGEEDVYIEGEIFMRVKNGEMGGEVNRGWFGEMDVDGE